MNHRVATSREASCHVACRHVLLCSALILLLMAFPALGQTTKPAAMSDQAAENQPLRLSENEIRAATTGTPTAATTTASGIGDTSRIAVALLVVIGLILLLRGAFHRMTTGIPGGRGAKLVTVLSRSIVSPKQQVLVLQVGKRLLVVGDSAGHMSALCEISDPDEIASMVGQTKQSAIPGGAIGFGSLFKRATEPFSETEALAGMSEPEMREPINPDESVSPEEIGGLLDKVRLLQQQFSESKQAIEAHSPAQA